MTPQDIMARVKENRPLSPDFYLLRLDCPPMGEKAAPGQFVMIRVRPDEDPLLRRPFSIHDVKEDEPGGIVLLYKVVGQGTKILSQLAPGGQVGVLGPLGRGFSPDPGAKKILLVAGGVGMAPMMLLARRLAAGIPDGKFSFALGARTKGELFFLKEFEGLGFDVFPTTEDGSLGEKGVSTDVLGRMLESDPPDQVFACGPSAMLKVVGVMAGDAGVSCQVSLEAAMACGMGACLGCAVEKKGDGYVHVCQDGPVMDSRLLW